MAAAGGIDLCTPRRPDVDADAEAHDSARDGYRPRRSTLKNADLVGIGSYGLGAGAEPRPVAAASSAGGLLYGQVLPPADAALPDSPSGTPRGWAFSSLVSSVFDAVRWPPDPWEVSYSWLTE